MTKQLYNENVKIEYIPNRNIYYDILYEPERVSKYLRKKLTLTQGELGDMLNLDQMTISAWETKASTPSSFNSKKILKYFKVDKRGKQ